MSLGCSPLIKFTSLHSSLVPFTPSNLRQSIGAPSPRSVQTRRSRTRLYNVLPRGVGASVRRSALWRSDTGGQGSLDGSGGGHSLGLKVLLSVKLRSVEADSKGRLVALGVWVNWRVRARGRGKFGDQKEIYKRKYTKPMRSRAGGARCAQKGAGSGAARVRPMWQKWVRAISRSGAKSAPARLRSAANQTRCAANESVD
jgi:hypothetical protein